MCTKSCKFFIQGLETDSAKDIWVEETVHSKVGPNKNKGKKTKMVKIKSEGSFLTYQTVTSVFSARRKKDTKIWLPILKGLYVIFNLQLFIVWMACIVD